MADEVVQTPFGAFLVTRGEIIGETTRAGTLWDGPGFLQVIAKEHGRLGEPGVTILDVGANQGAFSVWLASQGAWRVIAVEPQPKVMQRLKANLDLNKQLTGSTVIPLEVVAYSHRTTMLMDQLDPGNWGGTAFTRRNYLPGEAETGPGYPADQLDRYQFLFGRTVSLIKIDAQGCDGAILRGLGQTLRAHRPAVVFEWEEDLALPHNYTLSETLTWLTTLGYDTWEWPTHRNNYLALPKAPRLDVNKEN